MDGCSTEVLPPMDHSARRERLRKTIRTEGLDGLLVTAPSDVRYLTGFDGSNGAVLLGGAASSDTFVTDLRYRECAAALDLPAIEVARPAGEVVRTAALGRVGIDAEHLTLAALARLQEKTGPDVVFVPTTGLVAGLRRIKDEAEIVRLERACIITAVAMAWLIAEAPLAGRREGELAGALEERFLILGADGIAFPTIVASGPNASSPHHRTGDRMLEEGELVVIDAGARVDGYHADMTRTCAVGDPARLSGALREVATAAVAANAAGRSVCCPGVTPAAVDAAARDAIIGAGLGDHLAHPTGHGVGLDIHESPLLTLGNDWPMAVGTVFTVEPGVYVSGITGARVEDTVVLRAAGASTLTVLPRDIDELSALRGRQR